MSGGWLAERLIALVSKTGSPGRGSRVRIPRHPQEGEGNVKFLFWFAVLAAGIILLAIGVKGHGWFWFGIGDEAYTVPGYVLAVPSLLILVVLLIRDMRNPLK